MGLNSILDGALLYQRCEVVQFLCSLLVTSASAILPEAKLAGLLLPFIIQSLHMRTYRPAAIFISPMLLCS